MTRNEPIKVLVVDDSALVRQVLSRGIEADPQLSVVGAAPDAIKARQLILQTNPQVLTLDVEMPYLNGLQFLKQLMKFYPVPVIMVSALTEKSSRMTLDALAAGAVDVVLKPKADVRAGLVNMMADLRSKIKAAAHAHPAGTVRLPYPKTERVPNRSIAPVKGDEGDEKIIAIGASTGGIQAIRCLLRHFPANAPGTVIVQHLPAGFTRQFAEQLNALLPLSVKEAQTGDVVRPGHVFIAPGDYHVQVTRIGGKYRLVCRKGERVNGYRPSVEVLFRSVARYAGKQAVGILLTGMGNDGAEAMVHLRRNGALTIAQDKKTSVVWGMPKEAYVRGGASHVLPLQEIPQKIFNDHWSKENAWPN